MCSVPAKPAPSEGSAADKSAKSAAEEHPPASEADTEKFKSRIKSFLKNSEEDASHAERYLDRKREQKKQFSRQQNRERKPGEKICNHRRKSLRLILTFFSCNSKIWHMRQKN